MGVHWPPPLPGVVMSGAMLLSFFILLLTRVQRWTDEMDWLPEWLLLVAQGEARQVEAEALWLKMQVKGWINIPSTKQWLTLDVGKPNFFRLIPQTPEESWAKRWAHSAHQYWAFWKHFLPLRKSSKVLAQLLVLSIQTSELSWRGKKYYQTTRALREGKDSPFGSNSPLEFGEID